MISTDQVASGIVLGIGSLLFWANPKRKVNRSVFASSAVVAAWLACSHFAGSDLLNGLYWLRWTYASGALAPLTLWMVKESILGTFEFRNWKWMQRNAFWFITAALLFAVPFTELFIPSSSSPELRVRGIGHRLYYIGVIGLYARLLWDSLKSIKSLSGARKLELQVWLCGGCVVAASIYTFIGMFDLTQDPIYRQLKPVAVLVFYAATAYAITSYRIFDARQIFLVGAEKLTLMGFALAVAMLLSWILSAVMSETSTLLCTTALVVTTAGSLNNWLDRKFQFVSHAVEARQAAFATGQKETRLADLESSFRTLLKRWGQTEQALIIYGTSQNLAGSGVEVDNNSAFVRAMKSLRWVTPERLTRERFTEDRHEIAEMLQKHGLGLLVVEVGAALTVIIGVGIAASRRPYTYPQVTELMELASIIQGSLERAHFSAKAQRAEQLATVGVLGASVAHEIRNPLVSIKTFVQLLPVHYHEQVFRDKFFKLIGDEVERIDQLTQQLLDLATPRTYSAQIIELHPLLEAALDLVAARASHRQVSLIRDFKADPDFAFTDAAAAKQVALNLCFNAIQAVETHRSEKRWVRIATRNTEGGIEMAVADSGPGISPEMRPRLFQAFQTSKSSGFGLGLAICSDILSNIQANIAVDPPEPGQGATFRVTFPCQPLSS
jgi:signal transduction histidine kinase